MERKLFQKLNQEDNVFITDIKPVIGEENNIVGYEVFYNSSCSIVLPISFYSLEKIISALRKQTERIERIEFKKYRLHLNLNLLTSLTIGTTIGALVFEKDSSKKMRSLIVGGAATLLLKTVDIVNENSLSKYKEALVLKRK